MDKLTLAHDYYMQNIKIGKYVSESEAWNYADTMFEEAEKRKDKTLPDAIWKPDWSLAPDDLVKYFAIDEDGRGGWYVNKPTLCRDHWYWSDFNERLDNDSYDHAPSFGYTGDWRNSLRIRPSSK